MQNPKRPQKKEFIKKIRECSRIDKQAIILELLEILDTKLTKAFRLQIHTATKNEVKFLKERFTNSLTLKPLQVFKLYVVACYPSQEINHWIMDQKGCYRCKKPQRDRWQNTARTRRPTIRDVNGMAIPMSFRDKFLPNWVQSQREYDMFITDKLRGAGR
tara:strand:- start:654 stop:1133 length:480 start_codon:yes stop_codon:yes gene_type:complete